MKTLSLIPTMFVILLCAPYASSQSCVKVSGYVEQGGQTVVTSGITSTTKVQKSFPGSTITVYNSGTLTATSIFSNNTCVTAKGNPMTASSSDGSYSFYVSPRVIDLRFSGTGITTPWTISEISLSGGIIAAGVSYLSAGTSTTITNSLVAVDSAILAIPAANGIIGPLRVTSRVAATSFGVSSENGADAGYFSWSIGGAATGGGGGGGTVSSVFGRVGDVTALSNDYTWAQINKTTSSLADITTRSASDLSSGTLASARGGAGTINGIIKANGAGVASQALAGTDYELPLTFSTGLTRSTNTITVNAINLAASGSGGVAGILPAANGGTGLATLTANNVILGNGTSPVNFVAPGTSGNVLTSTGSTWTSAAAAGGISGLTTNKIPRATSSTAIGDSSWTDNSTTLIANLPVDMAQATNNFVRWTRDSSNNLKLSATLAPPTSIGAAQVTDGAGNCTAGVHQFKFTYVTAAGETTSSNASSSVTCDASHTKVTVTITTGSSSTVGLNSYVTGRNIYATAAGGSTYFLVATSPVIAENTSVTYTFNTADGSLSATQPPTTNTAIDTRFLMDNNGNVCWGCTGAETPPVEDNIAARYFKIFSGPQGASSFTELGLVGWPSDISNGLIGSFNFVNRNTSSVDKRTASIASYIDGSANTGNLLFGTAPNSTQPQFWMKLSSVGDLSIGSTTITGARVTIVGKTSDSSTYGQLWYDSNANFLGGYRNDNRLGIGTATPLAMLSVGASSQFQVNTTGGITGTALTYTVLSDSATAPTISSGFGTSPSIVANNGTTAFTVNIGTGGTASSGVIGMPTATTGWICHVENRTGAAANRADQRTAQTASSVTTVTVQNQTISTGGALAWTASDVLVLQCRAY